MRILDGSVDHLRPDTDATIKAFFNLAGSDLVHADLKQSWQRRELIELTR